MAKKLFELERNRDKATADYHELATGGKATAAELQKSSVAITKVKQEISDLISAGATERPKGVKPIGMKVRPGVYEVGNGEVRSRGETPEEAVQNWNDGVYFFKDGVSVTKEAAAE